MTDLTTRFDIHVISLPARQDRRRALQAEFRRVGIDWSAVQIFDAIRPADAAGFPSIGAHGCFRSHLAVLKSHIGRTRPLLICEDDLQLDSAFAERIGDVSKALDGVPWDLFYFGAHLCGQPVEHLAVREPSAKLSQLHMAAYNPEVLPRLVVWLEAMLERSPGQPLGPMHVDDAIALFRRDNPDIVTRVAVPPLGHQRASPSDIQIRGWHDRVPLAGPLIRLLRGMKNWLRAQGLWRRRPTA